FHTLTGWAEALHRAGARGTGEHFAYAFGMHLNPEMPALDGATVTRYMKAYACLYDWLVMRSSLDTTRQLTPYIEPFRAAYTALLVNPAYQPDLQQLIDDYLEHNPTRNRALDMLPLFAHLDEARVRAVVDDPRINPRPTLHYRLPNCEIERADWSFSHAWLDWLQVEHLADDGERLNEICRSFTRFLTAADPAAETPWSEQVQPWLVARDDL
ncbi:MAG: amidoligase family protein, partial [Gammaproteobacteria bacterium]|nr:amidoligase family protein [Gammaproteobacteria bacterium]